MGSAWTETPYVFTREDGSILDPEQVSDTFERLSFEAGCRRSGCTICVTFRLVKGPGWE